MSEFERWVERHERQWRRQGGRCYYCRCRLTIASYHLEHKTPLCRGGCDDWRNLVMSCAPCNWEKGQKTAPEYLRWRQRVYGR